VIEVFRYDAILIEEGILSIRKGNAMFFLIVEVFNLVPFKTQFSHTGRVP